MSYIRKLPNGKSQIIKDVAFCTLLNNKIPSSEVKIDELIKKLDNQILKRDSSVSKDALNNVHGDWYEWLIAISGWNFCSTNESANLALLTPNINQFDIARLYNDKLYSLILDLRKKVLESSSVQLISSNPDFVIINRNLVKSILGRIDKKTTITPRMIKVLESRFRDFSGRCEFSDIVGYLSVKTSFRPDRRLQIPHEGSLMKAIYTHIQTREWILNPIGLKYYAIATRVGEPDRKALKTVATHSITTVQSIPQAAVDEVFKVNSLKEAALAFSQILAG
jgi:hypothetical protein